MALLYRSPPVGQIPRRRAFSLLSAEFPQIAVGMAAGRGSLRFVGRHSSARQPRPMQGSGQRVASDRQPARASDSTGRFGERHMEAAIADSTYGFLTAVESATHGLFGGYLLVDSVGRPLEFHCTAPVKVSRAQQILYGTTLPGHLHGRQIGATLLAEGTLAPAVVLTDLEAMLTVRPHTSLPVVLVRPAGAGGSAEATFLVGGTVVSPGGSHASLQETLRQHLEALAITVDLSEPFGRIRAAIEEAQRH